MGFSPIMFAMMKNSIPVVELSTKPSADGTALTQEEASAVAKLVASLNPFAVKFDSGSGYPSSLSMASVVEFAPGVYCVQLSVFSGTYDLSNDVDVSVWKFFKN